jgi:translocation and assembly module TamA
MRRFSRRPPLLLTCSLLLSTPLAHAAVQLTVDGINDPLKGAVVSGVELSQYVARDISAAQARRLYEEAPDQVKAALAPYGYYDATTTGDIQPVGKDWKITLHVTPGEPVKITAVNLSMDKQAAAVQPIQRSMRALERLKDEPLNDGAYDDLRDRVSGSLTANGFLDAKLVTHRVEVNRAEHRATIVLAWQATIFHRISCCSYSKR